MQKALAKVRATNLDSLNEIISPLYSASGRLAKQQIEIFRSFLLMIHFYITTIDIWHQKLISDNLIAGLGGFSSEKPSVGSFYNFITRLYNQNETPRVQSIGFNKKTERQGQKS